MKIDPLPCSNERNKCPWCSERVIWAGEERREETECPHCSKPIVITRRYYDDTTVISAERSDTDRRYMDLMGIKEK